MFAGQRGPLIITADMRVGNTNVDGDGPAIPDAVQLTKWPADQRVGMDSSVLNAP